MKRLSSSSLHVPYAAALLMGMAAFSGCAAPSSSPPDTYTYVSDRDLLAPYNSWGETILALEQAAAKASLQSTVAPYLEAATIARSAAYEAMRRGNDYEARLLADETMLNLKRAQEIIVHSAK